MSNRRLVTVTLCVCGHWRPGGQESWVPILGPDGDPVTACVTQGDLEALRASLQPPYEWLELDPPRRTRR